MLPLTAFCGFGLECRHRSKWKLASAPFKGGKLFGEALNPVLIKNKDKKKVFPSVSRKADRRTPSSFQRQPFRAPETTTSAHSFQHPYPQGSDRTQDRSHFGTRAGSNFSPSAPFAEDQTPSPSTVINDHQPTAPIEGQL